MAYHEKSAWLTLLCMLAAYALYFGLVLLQPEPQTLPAILWQFGPIAVVQAIVVAVGNLVLISRAGSRGARQADERDRAIARRGASYGYYTLMAGMILVGVVMPFSDPAPAIVNTGLFALVCAECVRLATIAYSYRRGWHG